MVLIIRARKHQQDPSGTITKATWKRSLSAEQSESETLDDDNKTDSKTDQSELITCFN